MAQMDDAHPVLDLNQPFWVETPYDERYLVQVQEMRLEIADPGGRFVVLKTRVLDLEGAIIEPEYRVLPRKSAPNDDVFARIRKERALMPLRGY